MSAPAGGAVRLRSGLDMPRLGLGTWKMGEDPALRAQELAAIARAVEGGIAHLDTAEMYGEGATESLLGEALATLDRDRLFLTSKVYPWNADRRGMAAACEGSLARLGTDRLDLYLLHWPGSVPFEETLEGARRLREAGLIRAFGVSNVDAEMLAGLGRAGLLDTVEVNQVMYNPSRRGIEADLLPMMEAEGIACMAYTPLEPGRLARNAGFCAIAEQEGLDPAGLALAWAMTGGRVVPIPKAGRVAHVEALLAAAARRLPPETMAAIDRACPAPAGPVPLDIL